MYVKTLYMYLTTRNQSIMAVIIAPITRAKLLGAMDFANLFRNIVECTDVQCTNATLLPLEITCVKNIPHDV